MKLFVILSLYPVSTAVLHFYFDTHLISSGKGFPIINSKMSMMLSKLEAMFVVKPFEKGLMLSYLMIIAKVFECAFKLRYSNVKLTVLNNRYNR